ncbi:endonuclease [Methanosarcinales archaeon ex4572_44]|nr:MAG: endonuclease [Methanosarcinales archaeon ex4484_138]PHP45491.1 MAG: endonuclease [Methanosarcinales archaeon ex4572_44]RLG23153.1 MAG: endonuclease [Methanosarcinales archaeon]RLG28736.1 MAG: endonuclease [Methanosarcinales archaeon]HHI30655.1 endonuclease [Candidatus Methanoperedenaceae archaeon]
MIQLYEKLFSELGDQNWWPAETPFEVSVGAILTQQTRWESVERAITNLRKTGLLQPESLAMAKREIVEEQIRCTGFYRQKTERVQEIARYFSKNSNNISKKPTETLRKELLEIKGVGDETADSILLYAAERPKFVIDAYTRRISECIGIRGNYKELQQHFEESIPRDVELYKNFHALIVRYAKEYCNKKRCDECLIQNSMNGTNDHPPETIFKTTISSSDETESSND